MYSVTWSIMDTVIGYCCHPFGMWH